MQPFDFNLRHLRALGEIRSHGSLNRAAEAAGLSQPALTQGLSKIERQLGQQLFHRTHDGMAPTAAGLALSERAERAFASLAAGPRKGGARGFARPDRLMTATQASAFLHFADAGGFSGGASASGLSQPAIHRAVRELEQIWGVALAERRGRGMMLTPAGRTLARAIRLAAREIAAGIEEALGDTGVGGRIAVGAMPLSRALLLPRALAEFLRLAPATVVDVVEGSWRELIDPLREGSIDLMVGALRPEPPPGIEQQTLFEDSLSVFARSGHPLADRKRVEIEDLAAQAWVVGPAGTPLRSHWEALFPASAAPPVPVECGSVMVIRGLLAQSDLLTLLSPDQVALEVESGMLVRIPITLPGTVRTIGIATRAGWRPTRAQSTLIDLLRQASSDTRHQQN
jgi:DNA-binding transcriptional LysR family regulator